MPDPIQGVNAANPVGVAATGQAGSSSAAAQPARPQPSAPVDQADVGGTEALLTTIAQAAAGVPAIDEARVAELQQAIAAGTFQVDPQKTAAKLMQTETALSSGGGGG